MMEEIKTDAVVMETNCVWQELNEGEVLKEELHKCVIIASAQEYSAVSIEDLEQNVMVSVGIGDMVEIIQKAVAESIKMEMEEAGCLDNQTDATFVEQEEKD